MFPCNKWLSSGKDDKKIERELLPIASPATTTTTTTTTTAEKPVEPTKPVEPSKQETKEQPKEAPKEQPKEQTKPTETKVPEKGKEAAPTVDTAKTATTGSGTFEL